MPPDSSVLEGDWANGDAGSSYPDLHLADFVLDLAIERVFAQGSQIGIFGEPFEITITEIKRPVQGISRGLEFPVQTITAGKIVKHQRIGRLEFRKLLVHIETALVFPTLGVMVTEDLESLNVLFVAPDNSLHESDLNVEFTELFTR
jgi:hypothetical protein